MLVPYAVLVHETVIEMFDPLCHRRRTLVDGPAPSMLEEGFDPRYAAASGRSC